MTHRTYDCVTPSGTKYYDCHAKNVVYLITCDRCYLQYVDETSKPLNERFNWHRSCMKYPNKYGYCRRLTEHCVQGACKDSSYSVQIIEKLCDDDQTSPTPTNVDINAHR